MLKIASWNVNSLKVRLEQVIDWLESAKVDMLALQETKITDEEFPLEAFTKKGYQVSFSGQKTYNGVAVISRFPMIDILKDCPGLVDSQRRILALTIAGIRVINLYVPNGSELSSEKYTYKLEWLQKVTAFIQQQLSLYPKLVVLGDMNIAPEDRDVFDIKACEGEVLVSPLERQAFKNLLDLGLFDSFRKFTQPENSFSWWDYRAASFRRDRGLRIDHILLSKPLFEQCVNANIDKNPRATERPSDHAPVWVELDLI